MKYQAAIYRGTYPDRDRWAVYNTTSKTWTFPGRYGRKGSERLAARLNREA